MKAQTTNTPAFRAGAPSGRQKSPFGPLAEFTGSWKGKGFNLISLPDFQNGNPFRLKLNATFETLAFHRIHAPVPNRGSDENDISFMAMQYQQAVSDIVTNEGIHVETGMWLNLPPGTNDTSLVSPPNSPAWKWSVARMGSIPHGDALLAQGPYKTNKAGLNGLGGGPVISVLDSTPFTLNPDGSRKNETNPAYLAPFTSTTLPPGIPAGAIADPNLVLKAAIEGQNIVETVVLVVNAVPAADINLSKFVPTNPNINGAITNIPFLNANANANSFTAIFWIETVKNTDGKKFLQLQYTQTVILSFLGLNWPHISVATMIKE